MKFGKGKLPKDYFAFYVIHHHHHQRVSITHKNRVRVEDSPGTDIQGAQKYEQKKRQITLSLNSHYMYHATGSSET